VSRAFSWHHREMRIYTKKGDDGSTSLLGGARVRKSDERVAAYGDVDELNAVIGWARATPVSDEVDVVLHHVQETCFRAGAFLAAVGDADPGVTPVDAQDAALLEAAIDRMDDHLPPLKTFILPGGGESGSRLHVARTVCRRAERSVVGLASKEPTHASIVRWLNRLSDFLFVAARWENRDTPEHPWQGRRK
jgi:cob(I)alamin adenosyltransferase